MELEIEQPVSLSAKTEEVSWRWHTRYGHLNFSALEKLQKEEMVHGLPAIKGVNKLCDECLIDKQRRTPFPSRTSYRADEPLELVHGDIFGPIKPAEAAEVIKRIQARAEAECGKKMRVLRTDRGREFTSTSFAKYCDEFGIQRHLTAPYSPQ